MWGIFILFFLRRIIFSFLILLPVQGNTLCIVFINVCMNIRGLVIEIIVQAKLWDFES